MRGHLSDEQKQLAFKLRASGWRLVDIAREIGCTAPMVGLMVREGKFTKGAPCSWAPRAGCLSIGDREQILLGIGRGASLSGIAKALQRSPSTITREVYANGGREQYSAWRGHQRAREHARRPKSCKLRRGKLHREVSRRLAQLWSPQEIARRLPLDYPEDPAMRVSHETIYQSLFVQGRGELRRELARCLRSGRTVRRPRGRADKRGHLRAPDAPENRLDKPITGVSDALGRPPTAVRTSAFPPRMQKRGSRPVPLSLSVVRCGGEVAAGGEALFRVTASASARAALMLAWAEGHWGHGSRGALLEPSSGLALEQAYHDSDANLGPGPDRLQSAAGWSA